MRYLNLNSEKTGTARLQHRNKVYLSNQSRNIPIYIKNGHDDTLKEQRKKETESKFKTILTILDYIYSDRTVSELLQKLHSSEEHRQYADFFENWIQDTLLKKQEITNIINKQKKEGKNSEEILEYLKRIEKYKNHIKYIDVLIKKENKDNEKGIEPGDE